MVLSTSLIRLIGKTIRWGIVASGRGKGETAPGLVCLQLDPHFVRHTIRSVPIRIVISGTNGKTTTTSLVRSLLVSQNWAFVSNPTGSNLLRGIATASLDINHSTRAVLWETDEAALVPIGQHVLPTHLLLTNLFRDQLDRYGEIDTIFQKWVQALTNLPAMTVLLNADDPSLAFLGSKLHKHTVLYFGIDLNTTQHTLDSAADAIFCPRCHHPLSYNQVYYSHLGAYSCSCGFKRPNRDFVLSKVVMSSTEISGNLGTQRYTLPLTGIYNAYNLVAAAALGTTLDFRSEVISGALSTTEAAFGRQEIIKYHKKKFTMILVKNPTGFNQVLTTLKTIIKPEAVLIAINDQIADGTDVSWLWDVDFDLLNSSVKTIMISGDRAYDMALRLKYAGFKPNQLQVIPQLDQAMLHFSKVDAKSFVILPTYTAMWALQKIIKN